MQYIKFDGVSSLDKGLIINSLDIPAPKPKLITKSVPFQNGSHDFSNVGTGKQLYENIPVTIKFSFKHLFGNQTQIYLDHVTWLLGKTGTLEFKDLDGSLNSKCINISKLSKSMTGGTFTAIFSCYPVFQK